MQNYKSLGISNRFIDCTFENYKVFTPEQGKALKTVRNYAENFDLNLKSGRSLVLLGSTGTGKTHLAAAVLKHVHDQAKQQQRFIGAFSESATDYVEKFLLRKVDERVDMLRTLSAISLWHLDDLGRGSNATSGVQNAWCRIFDERYKNQPVDAGMMPVLVTTNLDPASFRNHVGDAAYDRLRENAEVVAMAWDSFRAQIQNKFETMHNQSLS